VNILVAWASRRHQKELVLFNSGARYPCPYTGNPVERKIPVNILVTGQAKGTKKSLFFRFPVPNSKKADPETLHIGLFRVIFISIKTPISL